MLEKILQLLSISCGHKRLSQPFTAAASQPIAVSVGWESVGPALGHYVVCLECGKKFQYDWSQMRVVR